MMNAKDGVYGIGKKGTIIFIDGENERTVVDARNMSLGSILPQLATAMADLIKENEEYKELQTMLAGATFAMTLHEMNIDKEMAFDQIDFLKDFLEDKLEEEKGEEEKGEDKLADSESDSEEKKADSHATILPIVVDDMPKELRKELAQFISELISGEENE
jgi:DnaJ-domain-containing protein 1